MRLRTLLGLVSLALLALGALAGLPDPAQATHPLVCQPDPSCRQACSSDVWRDLLACHRAGEPPRDCWRRARAQLHACIEARCQPVPGCEERCAIAAAKIEHRCLVAGGTVEGCRADAERAERACVAARCQPCVCPHVYAPVCGQDGNTYGNACEAACARVPVEHEGPCCEPVTCELFCPNGFETGPDGCEICQCRDVPACRDDQDCPVGEVCEPSGPGCGAPTCVPGCHADAQCPAGQACQQVACFTCPCPGFCVDRPPAGCGNDADCPAGEVCEPGGPGCNTPTCVPGCHADAQCPAGERCQQVLCVTCPCPGSCAP